VIPSKLCWTLSSRCWLLEEVEGLGAGVAFVFGEAADDAFGGEFVDGFEDEVQGGYGDERPEDEDWAVFGLQFPGDGEQGERGEEDGVEGEDDGEVGASGQAGASERDLGAAEEEEVCEDK